MLVLNLFVLFVNIQLYERGDYDDAVIGIYCGTTPPTTITTTSNVLVVKFITDLGIVHEGFNASYTRLYSKKKIFIMGGSRGEQRVRTTLPLKITAI